jgi:hypothetical protein
MAAGANAEILFFTGVRIVRVEVAEPPPQRPLPGNQGLPKRRDRTR